MNLNVVINGQKKSFTIEAGDILLDVLRREGYKSVKRGCETGECGACTVLINKEPMNSCMLLAVKVQGKDIVTIEGIGTPEDLHPIQQEYLNYSAAQCGFCTSGAILSAKALLDKNQNPTEEDIRKALKGNLCRCTGFVKPVQAIMDAAAVMNKK